MLYRVCDAKELWDEKMMREARRCAQSEGNWTRSC